MRAILVAFVVLAAALSAALMVSSVVPFLSVLADPSKVKKDELFGFIYGYFEFQSEYQFLIALGLMAVSAIAMSSALQLVRAWVVAAFTQHQQHFISHRLLITYLCQPYEYFLQNNSGEMSTQILSESQEVIDRFFRPALEAAAALLTVLSVVCVLFWVDWRLSLAVMAVFGTIYLLTFFLSKRLISQRGRTRTAANRERFRFVNEALSGVKDIKLLGREGRYVERFDDPARRMARSIASIQLLGEVPQSVMQAVGLGGIILLCLVILDPAGLNSGGAINSIVPVLGVFGIAGQKLLPELSRLYRTATLLQYAAPAVDAVYHDLKLKPAIEYSFDKDRIPLHRSLVLRDAVYQYPGSERPSLAGFNLSILAGEKIGTVGSTGAGKTTLAETLLGLLHLTSGGLYVDNKIIERAELRAWQKSVAYVPQTIFIADATIGENIALGLRRDEIDFPRLKRAARVAQIHEFITQEMPEGYDTQVGERGLRLSGGQRQRVGIARALYTDADLIVFDEATSALDNLTEAEVMAAIQAMPKSKTIILIAHRLSSLRSCDRIVVLEKGRIDSVGAWEELASKPGTFQKLLSGDK